jgi:hypothetical protein
MIALITKSGAFLHDLSEEQADGFARTKGFDNFKPYQSVKGWLFYDSNIPYLLLQLGISTCYIDLESIRLKRKGKKDYLKLSTMKLMEIWEEMCPIKDYIKSRG